MVDWTTNLPVDADIAEGKSGHITHTKQIVSAINELRSAAGEVIDTVDDEAGRLSEAGLKALLGLPVVSPLKFGATATGGPSEDDSDAIQQAIDSLGSTGGIVVLGRHRLATRIVMAKPRVYLLGGQLLGNGVYLGDSSVAPQDLEITMDGTFIDLETVTTGLHGVVLNSARRVNFRGVRVYNADHAVHIETRDWGQHTRRLLFDSACVFHKGNVGFYHEQLNPAAPIYGLGDIHIVGPQFSDFGQTIKISGIDGLILTDTTQFQAQNPSRGRGIDLDYITWFHIEGNNIFEAGLEGIYLNRFQNGRVVNNQIAWPGQLTASSAIVLAGGDMDGFSNSNTEVSHNFIQWATKHGIEQLTGVDCITMIGNRFQDLGQDAKYRVDLDTQAARTAAMAAFEHFAIVTPASATRTITEANIVTGTDPNTTQGTRFSFSHNGAIVGNQDGRGLVQGYSKALTLSGTTTSIDASLGYDRVNANHSSATVVNSITAGYNGQTLTIYALNGNTTIAHSGSGIGPRLNGAVSVAIPSEGTLVLKYTSGRWVEVSRSWQTVGNVTGLSAALGLKADKTYTDTELAKKVNGDFTIVKVTDLAAITSPDAKTLYLEV